MWYTTDFGTLSQNRLSRILSKFKTKKQQEISKPAPETFRVEQTAKKSYNVGVTEKRENMKISDETSQKIKNMVSFRRRPSSSKKASNR
jgi:adenine C2-methylase RlmN of 23S rRNA A2503 and tRNA A37